MVDIGSEIRRRREQLRWSGVKLATLAGISAAFLSRLERGKSYYSQETLMKIAGALGTSVDSLYSAVTASNVEDAVIGARRVPMLDYVQAGKWTGVDSSPIDSEMRETILTDLEHPPSTFAMRLRGDSTEPQFTAGDVIVVDPTIPPKPGSFVVATSEDGEATFKQYRSVGLNERGEHVFELHPLNPLYAVMRSDRQPIAIVGVVVEHRRYLRKNGTQA